MNFTRDDLHVWLAPLGCIERPSDQGQCHTTLSTSLNTLDIYLSSPSPHHHCCIDNDNVTQSAAVSVFDSDEEVLASVGIHFTQPTALSMVHGPHNSISTPHDHSLYHFVTTALILYHPVKHHRTKPDPHPLLYQVRIFNYNKSRIHCARGMRRCRLRLDDAVIFEGELRMATGTLPTLL